MEGVVETIVMVCVYYPTTWYSCKCKMKSVLVSAERPVNADQQERTLLKGVFSVRKGKTQLHKWAERQVILCGTCLIVASVKDSLTGKMHILPLVGGKVRSELGL